MSKMSDISGARDRGHEGLGAVGDELQARLVLERGAREGGVLVVAVDGVAVEARLQRNAVFEGGRGRVLR